MLERIYALAATFAGGLAQERQEALMSLCKAAEAELCARLRPEVSPEQCQESFICAAAWLALSNLAAGSRSDGITTFTAGEIHIAKGSGEMAVDCLRAQAELLMAPYTADYVSFLGVKG